MTAATEAVASSLLRRDSGLVWHPYAARNGPVPHGLRPFRDLAYTMPPYIATSGEIAAIGTAIIAAIAETLG
jgi:hypothetical protein